MARFRFTKTVAFSAAMFLAFGGAADAAYADEEPVESESVLVGDLLSRNASVLDDSDVALLSTELAVPEDEVRERFKDHEDFLAALAVAIESHPDRYSSSAWDDSLSAHAWVVFTGKRDDRLVGIFSSLPVPVEVRFGAALTEVQAETAQREAVTQIASLPGVGQVAGYMDPVNGTIQVEYEIDPEVGRSAETELAIARIERSREDVRLEIEAAEVPIVVEPEVLRGGAQVNSCTAGFTVRISWSTTLNGLLSAAHCPNAAGLGIAVTRPQVSTLASLAATPP